MKTTWGKLISIQVSLSEVQQHRQHSGDRMAARELLSPGLEEWPRLDPEMQGKTQCLPSGPPGALSWDPLGESFVSHSGMQLRQWGAGWMRFASGTS